MNDQQEVSSNRQENRPCQLDLAHGSLMAWSCSMANLEQGQGYVDHTNQSGKSPLN